MMAKKDKAVVVDAPVRKRLSMLDRIQAARRVSVPFVGITTADQNATEEAICARQDAAKHPLVRWDAADGLRGINDVGKSAVDAALRSSGSTQPNTVTFIDAMLVAKFLPKLTVLFVHNAHRQLQSVEPNMSAASVQGLLNLRDTFKRDFRMAVLMGPELSLPTEIAPNTMVLDHPLPDAAELRTLITDLLKEAPDLPKVDEPTLSRAVDAVSGLSTFLAEQVAAVSLSDEIGLDVDEMWERTRTVIDETPGLSVYRGTETFEDLRGLTAVKARLRQHVTAKTPVGVVVWVDEGADVFQNVDNDTSGNKTDQQRALLMEMQQNNWRGNIFVGVPGAAKSALAGAFGNEAKVPTIQVDFGAMESKWQGESEAQLRHAMRVIKAIGRGNAFFVLTCNSLRGIRPQFQRRFKRGIFFFDLPTKDERDAIWALYLAKFGFAPTEKRPNDEGWTGAEIRECVESAWDLGTSLLEAARYIIPVSRSRGQEIEAMRKEANGRFIDASKGGEYRYAAEPMAEPLRGLAVSGLDKKVMN